MMNVRRTRFCWSICAAAVMATGCAASTQWAYEDNGPPTTWNPAAAGSSQQPVGAPPTPDVVRGQQPGHIAPGPGFPNTVLPQQPNLPQPPNGLTQPNQFGPAAGPPIFSAPAPQGLPASQPPFLPPSPLVAPGLPPADPAEVDVILQEAQTGRIILGVGVNSDAGLIGNIVVDEQNFDITRWPTSLRDILDGTAFRGAGQRFRFEGLPGTLVQRYSVSFQEPYLLGTLVSFGVSGFYYDRRFTDWDEQRFGGRLSLGYIFPERRDLSTTVALRAESIKIANPAVPTPPELAEVVGDNDLYSIRWQIAHDTRDSPFLPTQGHFFQVAFEQGLGTFNYPRGEIDFRRYFVVREQIDGTGRHILGLAGRIGWTGGNTPIFEHYFAGGFSTIRGFDFRGASPTRLGVIVGGEFMVIVSAEYRFPLTANEQLVGSFFFDAGTVEEKIDSFKAQDIRLTPGFELRINIPAMGPVPIAIGFGFPIQHEAGDDIRNFHFFVGLSR